MAEVKNLEDIFKDMDGDKFLEGIKGYLDLVKANPEKYREALNKIGKMLSKESDSKKVEIISGWVNSLSKDEGVKIRKELLKGFENSLVELKDHTLIACLLNNYYQIHSGNGEQSAKAVVRYILNETKRASEAKKAKSLERKSKDFAEERKVWLLAYLKRAGMLEKVKLETIKEGGGLDFSFKDTEEKRRTRISVKITPDNVRRAMEKAETVKKPKKETTETEKDTTKLRKETEKGIVETPAVKRVKNLIAEGKDLNEIDEKVGNTLLHRMVEANETEAVQFLIKKRVKIDVKDAIGRTPLHIAASNYGNKCIKPLIKAGANVKAKDIADRTPLHVAAEKGRSNVIDRLISADAEIDAEDIGGRTPLHSAAEKGKNGAIKTLIAAGASVDPQNSAGDTPLHLAVENGTEEAIKTLIEAGANVNMENKLGKTPLDMVKGTEHEAMFIDAMNDVNARKITVAETESTETKISVLDTEETSAPDGKKGSVVGPKEDKDSAKGPEKVAEADDKEAVPPEASLEDVEKALLQKLREHCKDGESIKGFFVKGLNSGEMKPFKFLNSQASIIKVARAYALELCKDILKAESEDELDSKSRRVKEFCNDFKNEFLSAKKIAKTYAEDMVETGKVFDELSAGI